MELENNTRQLSGENSLEFILAGKAIFTLRSKETGVRYTYRVRKSAGKKPVYFVGVLWGSDNTTDYTYMGCIFDRSVFKETAGSKVKGDDVRFKAFAWVFKNLVKGVDISDKVEVWHVGRCGRCGRVLTVPESLELGLGPECASRV